MKPDSVCLANCLIQKHKRSIFTGTAASSPDLQNSAMSPETGGMALLFCRLSSLLDFYGSRPHESVPSIYPGAFVQST